MKYRIAPDLSRRLKQEREQKKMIEEEQQRITDLLNHYRFTGNRMDWMNIMLAHVLDRQHQRFGHE